MAGRLGVFAVLLGTQWGCRTALNYTDPLGPRYAAALAPVLPAALPGRGDTLHLVTFNIQFARHVDRAIELFRSVPALEQADVVTLQEMDAPGTERIAAALGMAYVYYPASIAPHTGRDFGNAILSRWPMVDDRKIILPHLARFEKSQRIATAATVVIGGVPVRVYSVHLGTMVDVGPRSRRDQARAILADAAPYPRVIVAGDMNNHGIGGEFRAGGYLWPTEHNPHTDRFWNWDHVFLRGLEPRDGRAAGVVRDNRGASDHRPVWVVVVLRAPAAIERTATSQP